MKDIDLTSPIPTETGVCRTCGSTVTGNFCSECGEKVFEPGEHSVRHFFGDVLNAITFLDSKFLRTLRLMLLKPGVTTYQYINGRRVVFIKPMSMFFIVNLIYFMFPLYNTLNSDLAIQMNNLPHSAIATKMVEKRVKEDKTDLKTFAIKYNQQSTNMAKMWLVLIVLYFSVPLWLVNYSKKMFYFDHLTAALEFCSLAVLYCFVALGWLLYLVVAVGKLFGADISVLLSDNYITPVSITMLGILLYVFERNAYKQSIFRALSKAAALIFFFFVVLQVYRASLFFITMWTI